MLRVLFIVLAISFAWGNDSFATKKYWHYDRSKFVAKSKIYKNVKLLDVAITVEKWDKKEKRVALYVKTFKKIYKDRYIFCESKKNYDYCAIEDDGGYIKLDKDMNIQLDVEFAKETSEGVESEFVLKQRDKKAWIKPLKNAKK